MVRSGAKGLGGASRSTHGSGPGRQFAAPTSERAAEQRASAGKVIRDAAETQHVPGERMVAGGDWLAELLLDPLDDARHAQAGAGNEDGVALGGGADVENGLLDGLRGDEIGRASCRERVWQYV